MTQYQESQCCDFGFEYTVSVQPCWQGLKPLGKHCCAASVGFLDVPHGRRGGRLSTWLKKVPSSHFALHSLVMDAVLL